MGRPDNLQEAAECVTVRGGQARVSARLYYPQNNDFRSNKRHRK